MLGGEIPSRSYPGHEIHSDGQEMGEGLSKAEVGWGGVSAPPPTSDLTDRRSGRCPLSEELHWFRS